MQPGSKWVPSGQPLYSIWDSHGPHLGSPCTQYGPHMGPIWAALVLNMGFKWAAQILPLWVDFEFRGRSIFNYFNYKFAERLDSNRLLQSMILVLALNIQVMFSLILFPGTDRLWHKAFMIMQENNTQCICFNNVTLFSNLTYGKSVSYIYRFSKTQLQTYSCSSITFCGRLLCEFRCQQRNLYVCI